MTNTEMILVEALEGLSLIVQGIPAARGDRLVAALPQPMYNKIER